MKTASSNVQLEKAISPGKIIKEINEKIPTNKETLNL